MGANLSTRFKFTEKLKVYRKMLEAVEYCKRKYRNTFYRTKMTNILKWAINVKHMINCMM